MMNGRIEFDALKLTRVLALVIAVLAAAHIVLQLVKFQLGHEYVFGLINLFDLRGEANLPAFFSSFQMVLVSIVLAAIGLIKKRAGDPFARHWTFLALIFLVLAADESAMMHELSVDPIRNHASWLTTGIFYWAWVLPGAILVLAVAFSYARFVFQYLPRVTRNYTVIGAVLFVFGAMGMEMVEGWRADLYGDEDLIYSLCVLVEETLEMVGILIFLTGLLKYFAREIGAPVLAVKWPAQG